MRAERLDGWLVLDGERAMKFSHGVDQKWAARLVQHGARVGTLPWITDEPEDFDWLEPPVLDDVKTARAEASRWLSTIYEARPHPDMDNRWLVFRGPDGSTALILEPFE